MHSSHSRGLSTSVAPCRRGGLTSLATTEAPATAPTERARTIDETLPPYRVIVHNDDANDMMYVVRSLLASVPELTAARALEVMLAAHHRGSAEVIVCFLERAELYRDRLVSRGLFATIERA
ncbi:MAG: ATP-dependent Clp protease adaptor ClpS [Dehalococcoidia bacterium]|nr:ATP-dependent Clp protease adaptor ClpS [Dehalococcoidia bacterium]